MPDWGEIKCYECRGHCNQKGYPSVTKGSKHCKEERGLIPRRRPDDKGFIHNLKMLLMNKGRMRSSGSDMRGEQYEK